MPLFSLTGHQNRTLEPEEDNMGTSADRRTLLHGRPSAIAAARRSRGVGIGLLAIAGALVAGDEARGQVGVESDREVLEALYDAAGGPEWLDNTNWLSDAPLSDWFGVTTNDLGRVERLFLTSNSLTGTIPPELSRLTSLERLGFLDNELSGRIPPELGAAQPRCAATRRQPVDRTDSPRTGAIDITLQVPGAGRKTS